MTVGVTRFCRPTQISPMVADRMASAASTNMQCTVVSSAMSDAVTAGLRLRFVCFLALG